MFSVIFLYFGLDMGINLILMFFQGIKFQIINLMILKSNFLLQSHDISLQSLNFFINFLPNIFLIFQFFNQFLNQFLQLILDIIIKIIISLSLIIRTILIIRIIIGVIIFIFVFIPWGLIFRFFIDL